MNKPKTLAAMAATALVGIIVPIALLLGGGEEELEEQMHEKIDLVNELIPNSVSVKSIRDQYKQIGCLTNHYKGEIVWNTFSLKDTEFQGVGSFFSDSTKSCLIVEYKKQKYKGDKWQGEFRLIWSVKDEKSKQGLIAVTNAWTQDKQLLVNSEAYAIKEFGNSKYFLLYPTEIKERARTKNDLKRLIPQVSSKLPGGLSKKKYWGFDPKLSNICGKEDCTNPESEETESYSWKFTGNKAGSETVDSWTSNITEWLKNIFDWKNLENKIKSIKGSWKKEEVNTNSIEE